MGELARLKNLGLVSEKWLNEMGVFTRDQLAAMGPVQAYHLLKFQERKVSLNLVYAIQGALLDLHWTALPDGLKRQLRAECFHEGDPKPKSRNRSP